MKSTNNEKQTFSMDDFEKGLMLAGLILPNSVADINDRLQLEQYEKELNNEKRILYFKRVVLAAAIADQLYQESTFGRVKFQKLVYLCEHAAQMNLQERYSKQVAGPFDNKFMHSIETEFKNNRWFEVEKTNDGKIFRSKYKPLEKVEQYKSYFESYFGPNKTTIFYIIDLFRSIKTDRTEIAATLYSCHLELRDISDSISRKELINRFYEWSEAKKRFDESTVVLVWEWMLEKEIVSYPCVP